MLSADELTRYGRQILLPEIGTAGQERLKAARFLVVGAGGLGSPAALYLAAAGIGTLGILDDDRVELSNLHRQVLHGTADVGRDKTASAVAAIARLNPTIRVRAHQERLTPAIAASRFAEYDLIVDGSDNYATRYAVNDACAARGQAWVYGSVERFSGQLSVFGAPGPCYRCIFPEAPAPGTTSSCDEIGVLGALPGIIGALQAAEALKRILGIEPSLSGRLLTLDIRTMETQSVALERNPDCVACAGVAQPVDAADVGSDSLEPVAVAEMLRRRKSVTLLDVREPWEWEIARIGSPRLLSMNDLPGALGSLDRSADIVVYCHHGVRSDMAAGWLRSQGFRARNLVGGIDRWSREVDPAMPRY